MDSNSFAPGGQGPDNNMTPQTPPTSPPAPEPVAPAPEPVAPAPAPIAPEPVTPSPVGPAPAAPAPTPVAPVPPTPTPEPTVGPSPMPESPINPTPINTPADTPVASAKKPSAKLFLILGTCLIVLALIIMIVFLIPFGDTTLWQKITSGAGNGIRTGDTVTSDGYTYTANLNLEYEPRGSFSDGLVVARDSNDNTVFLNNAGELAFTLDSQYIPASYGSRFSGGFLAVGCSGSSYSSPYSTEANDDFGYIGKTGELAITCQFASAGDFSNGYAVVSTVVETGESTQTEPTDSSVEGDDYYEIEYLNSNVKQKYGIINTSGEFVIAYQDYQIDVDSTFENGVYKATDPDTYIEYCFNLQGENLGEVNYYESNGCSDSDEDSSDATKEALQAKFGDDYYVTVFKNGYAAIASPDMYSEMFIVDRDGNKVLDVLEINPISVMGGEDGFSEGLLPIIVWDDSSTYPGLEAISKNETSVDETEILKNASINFYDVTGQVVFKYRYADHLDSLEEYTNN